MSTFEPFTVHDYTFYSTRHRHQVTARVYGGRQAIRDTRRHSQNAYVQFQGLQEASILFRGGRTGTLYQRRHERKFLEDLLVVGSILTGQNWELFSRRDFPQFPVVSRNHLDCIVKDANQCKQHLKLAVGKLTNAAWQKQFENGFHLRMLLNHANILNTETRFLSMIVIWEWLYPHLRNPNGASPRDESNKLKQLLAFILKRFWPSRFNTLLEQSNIFYVLRNQLAHSGKIPINRRYADQWMTKIEWEYADNAAGIREHLQFFDRLTQVVVLKTLGIDCERRLAASKFPYQLDSFLATGRI